MNEKKTCSKCGKEVFLGLYVRRKRLFRKKYKKWCFSCHNKLRFSAGKLELKEMVITGAKDVEEVDEFTKSRDLFYDKLIWDPPEDEEL